MEKLKIGEGGGGLKELIDFHCIDHRHQSHACAVMDAPLGMARRWHDKAGTAAAQH